MPSFPLKVIRPVFSLGGKFAPGVMTRLAFALFCLTPSRKPAGARAREVHAEGRRRLAAAQAIRFPVGRAAAMAYRFNGGEHGARRRILLVHGWGSAAAYISALAEGLAADGSEVVVLDFPGHGRSTGRFLHMRLAVETVVEAERRFGPFDAAVGHSFGGAALMLAAGGVMRGVRPIQPGRLAVIGSPSRIEWLFEGFSDMIGLARPGRERLVQYAETIAGAPLEDFDTVTVAQRIGTPLLVVHAEDDKEVHAGHARRFEPLPTARLHWANGLGHRRIISAPEVIETVRQFLAADRAREEGRSSAA